MAAITEKQMGFLKSLVQKVFKGQPDFIKEFSAKADTFTSTSASIMISGLKQELDIRKLPSSLRLSVYSASNLDDMGTLKAKKKRKNEKTNHHSNRRSTHTE